MNTIRRDLNQDEEKIYKKEVEVLNGIPEIIARIKSDESKIEDYPEELQTILRMIID